QGVESLSGTAEPSSGETRGKHLVDEPRAVLCSGGGKIGPGLSPTFNAVLINRTNEDSGAVRHRAERRHHLRRQRVAIAECLDRSDREAVRRHVADLVTSSDHAEPRYLNRRVRSHLLA